MKVELSSLPRSGGEVARSAEGVFPEELPPPGFAVLPHAFRARETTINPLRYLHSTTPVSPR